MCTYVRTSGDGPLLILTPYLSLAFSAAICPSLLFLFLISVSLPVLPSCSSYFSLLPGARRSVPDGNSLRLQEPPWRPHGGGTGGEQSGPVLPRYPSLARVLFSPFPPLFSLSPLLLFSLSLYLLCIQPARLHRSSGWLSLGSGPSAQSPLLFFFTHHFPPNSSSSSSFAPVPPPLSSFLLQHSPWGEDGEAIQSRAVHQRGCLLAAWQADTSGAHIH